MYQLYLIFQTKSIKYSFNKEIQKKIFYYFFRIISKALSISLLLGYSGNINLLKLGLDSIGLNS